MRINAFEKPLSIIEFEIAINTVVVPIIPNSLGDNILAKINPTRNVLPELKILSIKLHWIPLRIVFLKVLLTVFYELFQLYTNI